MAKNLVIVESPAKCKTIKKFLGRDFAVEASMGHVKDLPTKSLGVDLENGFEPKYVTIRGKMKVINKIRTLAQKAEKVYLATDPDREGEAIAWHLGQFVAEEETAFSRITFNEITRDAVREALNHPHSLDMNKVNAQQARRVLDRLVGYKVSPFLWRTIHGRLSAGRVQSVALRLICEREAEIEKFEPVEYWSIGVMLKSAGGELFEAELAKVDGKKAAVENAAAAEKIRADLQAAGSLGIAKLTRRNTRKNPRPPFITSTLQQDAYGRLGFSTKKTMMVAQQLYEGIEIGTEGPVGLITYMRTDSTRIADEAVDMARTHIGQAYGPEYVPSQKRVYKTKKGSQDAHEAIRPSSVERTPESVKSFLTRDQMRLYELIWKRFVASQMECAQYDQTKAELPLNNLVFQANGSILKFKGYLAAYEEKEEKDGGRDRILPELNEGDTCPIDAIDPKQHFTQPPPRYSEATLVKELEVKGIGRPSTYAQIISTNVDRKYIVVEEKRFHPTELGTVTNKLLTENFPDVFNVGFTAGMEEQLDMVEEGTAEWGRVLKDFFGPFQEQLDRVDQQKGAIKKNLQEHTGEKCDKCGNEMLIKWGRNGKFMACSGFPQCRNTKPLDASEDEKEIAAGQKCPKCNAEMVVKSGRFGRFMACSAYPACKTTMPITIGVKCPEKDCDGSVVERVSKRGRRFYSCSNYPKCKYVSWDKPVDQKCPACGNSHMVEKWSKKDGACRMCPECKHRIQTDDGAES